MLFRPVKSAHAWLIVVFVLWARLAGATEVVLVLPPEAQGLSGHLSSASLSIAEAAKEDATPQDLLAAARADYARMVAALYEVGRYGAVVSIRVDGREAADISPLGRTGPIGRIELRVQPGPLFTFSEAAIGPLAPATELPQGFRTGAPAYSAQIGAAAAAAGRAWREAGHAKVDIEQQAITADHRQGRLGARLVLDPGPRLTFGDLLITRPSDVRPARIREIAGLPTGRVYSPAEVKDASDRLRRTGAFQSVILAEADAIGPGNTLDITAELVDAKPRRFGFGAEISSLEGLALSGFWMHRNLFGGAERLRIEGEVGGIGGESGGIDYTLSARFDRPATFTPDTDFVLGARIQELDEPDYRERSARLGAGLAHIFSDTLRGEAGIAYQYSDIDDALGSRQLEHVLFPVTLTYDTRDTELNAKSGAFVELDATPFVGVDNSSLGARIYMDARGYQAFGQNDRLVFATRAQIGTINGASITEVPPEMLFFSGGAGTVRGQAYQSLGGTLLPGGTQLGGRSFAAISAELRADVKGKWSVVGFADHAIVASDSWWEGTGGAHSGAGFGVRYDTGLGPIRVDIATPLDSNAGERIELYIGIGQAF